MLRPKKKFHVMGRQSSNSWVPTNEVGQDSKKGDYENNLPSEVVKWCEIAADRNQWRSVCGFKILSATKETPTSSR
jgi:hypothetical protein